MTDCSALFLLASSCDTIQTRMRVSFWLACDANLTCQLTQFHKNDWIRVTSSQNINCFMFDWHVAAQKILPFSDGNQSFAGVATERSAECGRTCNFVLPPLMAALGISAEQGIRLSSVSVRDYIDIHWQAKTISIGFFSVAEPEISSHELYKSYVALQCHRRIDRWV